MKLFDLLIDYVLRLGDFQSRIKTRGSEDTREIRSRNRRVGAAVQASVQTIFCLGLALMVREDALDELVARLKQTSSFKGGGEGERDRPARVSAAFLALRRWSLGREHLMKKFQSTLNFDQQIKIFNMQSEDRFINPNHHIYQQVDPTKTLQDLMFQADKLKLSIHEDVQHEYEKNHRLCLVAIGLNTDN
ncbi:LOW QUALITY PROTEIN: hypothetical protein HID58_061297 [Brassica napus]|uniref:Uncharacterized protein n=1 Tax=Brassica napus TaxID=3708 RepID=A0ABQ7ZZ29_BRANA|nr:LOW QUALITY PROTEIN: hypothetical protein HID58_061297 [Brassica napus]